MLILGIRSIKVVTLGEIAETFIIGVAPVCNPDIILPKYRPQNSRTPHRLLRIDQLHLLLMINGQQEAGVRGLIGKGIGCHIPRDGRKAANGVVGLGFDEGKGVRDVVTEFMELQCLELMVRCPENELNAGRVAQSFADKLPRLQIIGLDNFGVLQEATLALDYAPHQGGVVESLDDPLLHVLKREPQLLNLPLEIGQQLSRDLLLVIDLPLEADEELIGEGAVYLVVLNVVEVEGVDDLSVLGLDVAPVVLLDELLALAVDGLDEGVLDLEQVEQELPPSLGELLEEVGYPVQLDVRTDQVRAEAPLATL